MACNTSCIYNNNSSYDDLIMRSSILRYIKCEKARDVKVTYDVSAVSDLHLLYHLLDYFTQHLSTRSSQSWIKAPHGPTENHTTLLLLDRSRMTTSNIWQQPEQLRILKYNLFFPKKNYLYEIMKFQNIIYT